MSYFGGKAGPGTYHKIINLIPPHEVYIEPFAGGAAIYRYIKRAKESYLIDKDPAAVETLLSMQDPDTHIFEDCGIRFLQSFGFEGTEFVYCDPPYLWSTRKSHHRYEHELSENDHLGLLQILKTLPVPVMLSGYFSGMYWQELKGWNHTSFEVSTRGNSLAVEHLWYNYPTPTELHDYRFIGTDFTDRQRIQRKIRRWVNRLKKLPRLERAAILNSIAHSQE
jgi:site-specific DNA-adenine methylase